MISSIKDKINTLAHQKTELEEKVVALEGNQKGLESKIEALQTEVDALTEKNKVLKMAKSLSADVDENNTDTRQKINELVREIDKCIALLNK